MSFPIRSFDKLVPCHTARFGVWGSRVAKSGAITLKNSIAQKVKKIKKILMTLNRAPGEPPLLNENARAGKVI